jgi:hypothetical protein
MNRKEKESFRKIVIIGLVLVVGYLGYQSMTSGSSPFSEASTRTSLPAFTDGGDASGGGDSGAGDENGENGDPGELTFPQLCESKGGRVIPGEFGCWCEAKGIYINPHFNTCTGELGPDPTPTPRSLPKPPKCTMECQRGGLDSSPIYNWQTIKDCPEGAFAIPPAVELRYEWACGGFHIPGQIKPVPFCLSEGDLGQQVTINCAIE